MTHQHLKVKDLDKARYSVWIFFLVCKQSSINSCDCLQISSIGLRFHQMLLICLPWVILSNTIKEMIIPYYTLLILDHNLFSNGITLLISQCKTGSVQYWVALFVEASKQIEYVALGTVKDSMSVILIIWIS